MSNVKNIHRRWRYVESSNRSLDEAAVDGVWSATEARWRAAVNSYFFRRTDWSLSVNISELVQRGPQEAQLPQRNSASAAHMEGG